MTPGLDSPSAASLHEPASNQPNLIAILWRGRRWYLACVLTCLATAGVYLVMAPRIYRAEVCLLVLQQGGRPLNVANTDPDPVTERTEDYIPTHMLIIGSPQVVKRASTRSGWTTSPRCSPSRGRV